MHLGKKEIWEARKEVRVIRNEGLKSRKWI